MQRDGGQQRSSAPGARRRGRSKGASVPAPARGAPRRTLKGLEVRIGKLGEELRAFLARERSAGQAVDVDLDPRDLRDRVSALEALAAQARRLAAQAEGDSAEHRPVLQRELRPRRGHARVQDGLAGTGA